MKKLVLMMAFTGILISFVPKPITWVAIGDSITYLNEHPDETGNRVTKGYLTRVTEQLPGVQYINQGHNGWTSMDIAGEIEKLGLQKADVYSVLLGTNDWWQGKPIGTMDNYRNNTGNSTVTGSFRIIINKLRSLNKNAKIILMTPLQRSDFVYLGDNRNNAWGSYKDRNGQSLASVADAIAAIARYEHFTLVDLYYKSGITLNNMVKFKRMKDPHTGVYKNYTYPSFVGIPFNPAADAHPYPPEAVDMTYDGLHPSDKGNAVIANMLVKVMK